MRFPWDRNWFKICFYVVVTFIMIYIVKLVIDMCAYTLINVSGIADGFCRIIKRLAGIFAPIITALAAYYVLKPPAAFIKAKTKSRRAACIIVFALIILPPVIFITAVVLRLRAMGGGSFTEGISVCTLLFSAKLASAYSSLVRLIKSMGLENLLLPYIDDFLLKSTSLVRHGGNGVRLAVSCILNFLLGMVMAFYLLMEEAPFSRFKELMRLILPERLYNTLKNAACDIDAVLSGYIMGQLTDGLIMSVLLSAALWLTGIPFAPAIGILSGFSNLVPYLGSVTGLLLTILSALLSGDYAKILYGSAAVIILQQIDSVYIVPKVVGKRVEVSPFTVIAALTAGGKLFGIWGMVFAVPAVAAVKAATVRICERKTKK